MSKEPKSPQEKKRLSLAKDRRNDYCENDKSSRKNIPRSKAISHRKVRHKAAQLERTWAMLDEQTAEATELTLVTARTQKGKFRKVPDAPLGRVVAGKLIRRAKHRAQSTD